MTTLDPQARTTGPGYLALCCALGVFLTAIKCAAGCGGVDDPCDAGQSSGVISASSPSIPTTGLLVTTLLLGACDGGGDTQPTTSTTTGVEPGSLGVGEPCPSGPLTFWPAGEDPCKEGLLCANFNICGEGLCEIVCTVDDDCPVVDGNPGVCRPTGDPWSDSKACIHFCDQVACPTSFAQELVCNPPSCDVPDVCDTTG